MFYYYYGVVLFHLFKMYGNVASMITAYYAEAFVTLPAANAVDGRRHTLQR